MSSSPGMMHTLHTTRLLEKQGRGCEPVPHLCRNAGHPTYRALKVRMERALLPGDVEQCQWGSIGLDPLVVVWP